MGKGNYGALRRLTPIETDFGKIARDQEQIEAQKRAEQRAIDREKKANQEKKDAQKRADNDKLDADLSKNTLVTTGVPVVDERLIQYHQANAEDIYNNWRQIQSDPNGDKEETARARIKKANLLNSPKYLKENFDFITNYNTVLKKGIDDDSMSESQNKDNLDNLIRFTTDKNFRIVNDEKGMPVYTIGEGDTKEAISYGEFKDSNLFKDYVMKFKPDAFKTELGNLGTHDTDVQDGLVTVGGKNITKNAASFLKGRIKEIIGTDFKSATGTAKSIWVDDWKRDIKDFDANGWKEVHDYVQSAGLSGVDTSYSRREDQPSKLTKEEEENAKKNGGMPYRGVNGEIAARIETWGGIDEKGKRIVEKTVDIEGGATLYAPYTMKTTGNDITINSVFLGKDKKIYMSGYEFVSKAGATSTDVYEGKNTPIAREISQTHAQLLAAKLKLKDASELGAWIKMVNSAGGTGGNFDPTSFN